MGHIGSTDGHGYHFGILQHGVIIRHSDAGLILLHALLCLFGDNVAEIFNFHILAFPIGRDMCRPGDTAAADNANFHFFHNSILSGV